MVNIFDNEWHHAIMTDDDIVIDGKSLTIDLGTVKTTIYPNELSHEQIVDIFNGFRNNDDGLETKPQLKQKNKIDENKLRYGGKSK
jgi:hypothetical protein